MVSWYYLIVLFAIGGFCGFFTCALLSLSHFNDLEEDAVVWRKKYYNLYKQFQNAMQDKQALLRQHNQAMCGCVSRVGEKDQG